jgi:hypothetical protein
MAKNFGQRLAYIGVPPKFPSNYTYCCTTSIAPPDVFYPRRCGLCEGLCANGTRTKRHLHRMGVRVRFQADKTHRRICITNFHWRPARPAPAGLDAAAASVANQKLVTLSFPGRRTCHQSSRTSSTQPGKPDLVVPMLPISPRGRRPPPACYRDHEPTRLYWEATPNRS